MSFIKPWSNIRTSLSRTETNSHWAPRLDPIDSKSSSYHWTLGSGHSRGVHHLLSLLQYLCPQEVLGHLVIHWSHFCLEIPFRLLVRRHKLRTPLLWHLSSQAILASQGSQAVHQVPFVLSGQVLLEAPEYPLKHHQELLYLLDILFLLFGQVCHLFLADNLFLLDPKKNIKHQTVT